MPMWHGIMPYPYVYAIGYENVNAYDDNVVPQNI